MRIINSSNRSNVSVAVIVNCRYGRFAEVLGGENVCLNGLWLLCPCPAPPHVAMNSNQFTPRTKQSHLRMLHGCLRPTLVQCGTRFWAKHMPTMCLAKSKV